MINAYFFDGTDARRHPVALQVGPDHVAIAGDGIARREPRATTRVADAFAGSPCIVRFADGAHCEVHDPVHQEALLTLLQVRRSLVQRWEDRWATALAAVVLIVAAVFAAWRWGIPWAVESIAARVPASWEQALGKRALETLDSELLSPTRLTPERQAQAAAVFRMIRPAQARMALRLEFRYSKALRANALALPDGTIILTDDLVYLVAGTGSDIEGALAHELAGVLAHEIAHIERRHSLRKLLDASLTGTLAAVLFGDFSGVAAAAPTILLQAQYSRAMELEADADAARMLRARGIPPRHLADLLENMASSREAGNASAMPSWLRRVAGYLSTHPSTPERIERLRALP